MQCNGNKQMIISLGIILISSNIFSWPSSPGKIISGTLARNEAGAVLTKSTQHKPAAWQSWKKQLDSQRHKFLLAQKTQKLQHALMCVENTVLVEQCWSVPAQVFGVHCSKIRNPWKNGAGNIFYGFCNSAHGLNPTLWWGFDTFEIFAVYTIVVVHGTTCTIQLMWFNVILQCWWLWWWWWW